MNRLITRPGRRARATLGSTMAMLVALPLGAALGMAPAVAAPEAPAPAASSTSSTTDKTGSTDTSSTLGEAVPWTDERANKAAAAAAAAESFDALVFSKTAAFRHANIPDAIAAIQKLGADNNFTVTATEDATVFTEANLAQYEVVIFLSTTGDVLNPTQQTAFENYIKGGGGYAGIHAASDTEYDWPWYGNLVGAYFNNHPNGTPTATVKVEDPAHASTAGITARWQRTDEWYNFRGTSTDLRKKVHVLASMDETSYAPGTGAMGAEHPIAWCQDYQGGRSWYTGMGHTSESFVDPTFLTHILGGIQTAAGVVPSDCKATLEPSFQKVALDENTSSLMELAVAEDGRVFYIERNGEVRIILPNGNVVVAGTIPVYTGQEFGLLGIALDPDFATNNWVYLYHSPPGESLDRISRFTMSGNTLQTASAVKILDVPTQRNECCHAGGAMEFDNTGNLYLTVGDNTNPFASDGYNPIDERAGREAWDAQRTSGNTNTLNGKVLRIKPLAAGGYSIPAGNLFDEAQDTNNKTRPEIYAMGFRNPFRMGLDVQNNKMLVADYGPDATSTSATRGPNGIVEWNILDQPGNYGWPYCIGDNKAFGDYNFANSTAGAKFDCAAPVNDSPNNTGLTNLPAAKPAVIWQSNNASSTSTPEIGASGAPMTSGTYAYDKDLVSDRKWPAYFDRKAIWADWNNSRLFTVQMNQNGTNYTDINRFLPSLAMKRPHALQFGPDGALYMIEWGSGFNGNNTDSGIYRIDYVEGSRAPVARATTDKTSGGVPLTVAFDGTTSFDGDTGTNTGLTYAWDFNGDGTTDSTNATASYTYTAAGTYSARLTVTATNGRTATTTLSITAGNTAPTVKLVLPKNGGFFEFGDTVKYEVQVTDPEDTTIDCSKVVVTPGLGHDQHAHDYEQYTGCTGSFPLPGDSGHSGANIFGVIKATYTDNAVGNAGALTGVDGIVLHTKKKEAEFFDTTGRTGGNTTGTAGVTTQTTTDTGGGQNVTGVETGDWFAWDVMNLTNINGVTMRAASTTAGATFEVRQGSPTGTAIGTLSIPNTGGAQTYQDVSTTFTGATTTSLPLYFVATTGGANVNWLQFNGKGVTDNQPPVVTVTASKTSGAAPLPVDFTSTVSDPDNDVPVTYAWTFGDGGTATTANPSHTFAAPGKYTVSLTVTDARGAKATRTTQVTVTSANTCFNGRSDDFVGNALDTTRWDKSVRVNQSLTVADGSLNIPLTNSDIYQTTNTTPNIVLQDLPAGAFEVTTKVDLTGAKRGYQQGGLIIYGDDNNYLKLVYSGRSTATDGSKAANVIQFAKEVNGTASESNSTNLGASFPDVVYLRMTSANGTSVTPTYSTDGATWLPITTSSGTAPARDLTGITSPKVGLLALASTAAGAADNLVAKFDYFTITPDDKATPCSPPCVVEDFNGSALGNDWSLVRPSGNLTVSNGSVKIPLEATDLYQTTNTARDLVLRTLPSGGFVATTKVTAPINRSYQSAGLLIYGDDDNYLKHVFQGRSTDPNAASNIIQTAKETAGTAAETNTAALGASFPSTVWLRLTSEDGTQVLGSYSTDGVTWTNMSAGYSLTSITNPKIGLLAAANTANGAGITASFDFFTLGKDDTCVPGGGPTDTAAPTTTLTIPSANAAGWYTTRPSFTLAATDGEGGSGVASTEYRIAGGAWTPYTAAVSVPGEGTRLIEYRSTDSAGNVEAIKSQSVKIDTVAPTATLAIPAAGGSDGWYTERPSFTLTGADGTDGSGIASIEYRIAGGDWMPYSLATPVTGEGARLVEYRAKDTAGTVGSVASRTVNVDTVAPTVSAKVGGDRARTITLTATDATSGVASIEYQLDDATTWTTYTSPVTIDEPGTHVVRYRATDVAGQRGTGELEVEVSEPGDPVVIEKPSVSVATVPAAANGRSNWFTRSVAVVLTGAGGDGKLTIEHRIGNGPWTAYTAPFEVTADGVTLVQARATDAAGTTSPVATLTVKIDTAAPEVAVTGISEGDELDASAVRTAVVTPSDAASGVAERSVTLDGRAVASPVSIDAMSLRSGTHTLEVAVRDEAGNLTTRTITFTVVPTYAGSTRLVKRLDDEGTIGPKLAKKLVKELKAAGRADRKGHEKQARQALRRFTKLVRGIDDEAASAALKSVARTLKAQL
ncbi:ThuA domain-containing protein [Nocardioides KLBMP 9356]|uniref:ThuA domain-containing protein n=1 Tax=Nocardioides potassii TaxID=2911371 RepID=A0ABS9H8S8_9ACTN|nr:ThuA domain-containing protein [Nocardioides potassii]MCF6376869.1 ThuA domain-containing protein [Nocardioides potassii]